MIDKKNTREVMLPNVPADKRAIKPVRAIACVKRIRAVDALT